MLHTQASALVPTFQDEEIIKPAFVFLPLILHQLRVSFTPDITMKALLSVQICPSNYVKTDKH